MSHRLAQDAAGPAVEPNKHEYELRYKDQLYITQSNEMFALYIFFVSSVSFKGELEPNISFKIK